MFRGADGDGGFWWFTPGGGVEAGEIPLTAAFRELAEETGHRAEVLAGPVFTRRSEFVYGGRAVRQQEWYFVCRVESLDTLSSAGWTDGARVPSGGQMVDGRRARRD